jgi:hydroxymethylpyrimidine kinase/phosphomethylpyrimidine kinase
MPIPICLTIAGSDPSGGAGLQGDLKTFCVLGAYGMAVPTAITVQNSLGVEKVHALPGDLVAQQIDALLRDSPPHAIKLGMLANSDVASAVARSLHGRGIPLVIDPIARSSSGVVLLDHGGAKHLCSELLPHCTIITPNASEAGGLVGHELHSLESVESAALELLAQGAHAVLITGGDSAPDSPEVIDVFAWKGQTRRLISPRIRSRNTHGTGCALSAALCVALAQGQSIEDAVGFARGFVMGCIQAPFELGQGIWPVNHSKF